MATRLQELDDKIEAERAERRKAQEEVNNKLDLLLKRLGSNGNVGMGREPIPDMDHCTSSPEHLPQKFDRVGERTSVVQSSGACPGRQITAVKRLLQKPDQDLGDGQTQRAVPCDSPPDGKSFAIEVDKAGEGSYGRRGAAEDGIHNGLEFMENRKAVKDGWTVVDVDGKLWMDRFFTLKDGSVNGARRTKPQINALPVRSHSFD
jgi:hypothetical protein